MRYKLLFKKKSSYTCTTYVVDLDEKRVDKNTINANVSNCRGECDGL